jgi:hypothetical protein
MFQVIATTTRKAKTQNWDLRTKNGRIEFSQTFFGLNDLQNNELTFGKSNDTYLLMISPNGQFYKKTKRGENKSKIFSNPTISTYLQDIGETFKMEFYNQDESGIYYKFVAVTPEEEQEVIEIDESQLDLDFTMPVEEVSTNSQYSF